MGVIAYITVNLLLFSSWYILLFRNKPCLSFVDRVLGSAVLGLAQIILTEMVLGVLFKKLYATPLFILNISISLGVLVLAVIKGRPNPPAPPLVKGDKGGLLTDIFKDLKDNINHFFNIIRSDWILLTVFILFFVSFCYSVFIGYLFPPYTWDALFYHLPTIGFILQSGTIENIPYNSLIYTFINIFPKNIDLFFLWNIIFLKSDTIVDLSQMFFVVAGMLAIYSIALKLKIKEKYAVYASFLFYFAPVIILQSTANYVDIAVSVLFLIAINFFMCDGVEESCPPLRWNNWTLLLAGLTAGILFGSKGSGPLFVIALSILFFIREIKVTLGPTSEVGRPKVKKIIARYAVYFIVPVILLGIYWYIQNWVHYNNPVYPFHVTLFGKTLFPGVFTEILHSGPDFFKEMSPVARPFYVWLERVEYYFYASELSGLGTLWFILFLPAIIFSVFHAVWKKNYDFLSIAAIIIFVFFLHPNNWNTRYGIFIFGLGCLSFGILTNYFEKKGRVLQFLALLFVIYTFFTSNSPSVTPEKIKEFVHLPAKERTLARMQPYVLNKTQRGEYGLWAWISKNVSGGDVLAYTFHPNLIGPLWNSSFSNKIVYVKAGKFEDWVEKLEANNATYVLVLVRPRSMEHFWLSRLAELRHIPKWSTAYNRFRLTYSDSNYVVMEFVK